MNYNPKLNIEKYEVSLLERKIVLELKEHQGARTGKAIFKGVWGHQFANVLQANIVTDIRECDPEELHQKYLSVLQEYQQCGLPFNCYDSNEFSSRVIKRNIKPVVIVGQYGFNGWVLCEKYGVRLKET